MRNGAGQAVNRLKSIRRLVIAPPRPRRSGDTAVVLALAACSVVAGAGMRRLFTDNRATLPIVLAALIAHAGAWAARRLRIRTIWAAAASLVVTAFVAAQALFSGTTRHGWPTPATRRTAAEALRKGAEAFLDARPPVQAIPGFILFGMAAVWLVAWIADTAALRLRLVAEALVPSAAIVVFTGAMSPSGGRTAHLGTYALSAAAVAILANRRSRRNTAEWFGARLPTRPVGSVAGIGIAAVAAATALILPHAPGVSEQGLVTWRAGDLHDKPSRVTVSPLVSVRSRLVNQSDRELFTVIASEPAYWRLTSLDKFDGAQWSGNGRYRKTGTKLPGAAAPGAPLVQEYHITGLSSDWLPAAYRAREVEGLTKQDRPTFDPESGSLLSPRATGTGYRYRVTSAIPILDAPELGRANDGKGNTDLPPNFSRAVVELARQITTGATTPFAKAQTLQDFFRRDYAYDTTVAPPSGPRSVEDFLFKTRRGYCEQFSSAFAAMARSLGLPTRVAVGFTPGVLTDGVFHVAGRNAHAWPEVLLDGIGWVAFEPTPGKSIPGGEGYTGVAYVPETASQTVATTTPATTVTASPPTTAAAPQSRSDPGAPRSGNHRNFWLLALGALCLMVAVGLGGLAVARRVGLRRRRSLTQAEIAWEASLDELSWLGVAPRADESGPTFAVRAGRQIETAEAEALNALAHAVDAARFAPVMADQANTRSVSVTNEARHDLPKRLHSRTRRLPARTKARRLLDPRLRSRR